MRQFHRTSIVIAAAVAALAIGAAATVAVASGAEASATDEQPSLIEDYAYPDAAKVFADYHVQLISGDGHILIVDCPVGADTIGLVHVQGVDVGQNNDGKVCFQVTGATGHLSLNIPRVLSIRGDGLTEGQGHKLKAELTTAAGQHSTVDVDPSGTTQVGIGGNPSGAATTLLQLDASS